VTQNPCGMFRMISASQFKLDVARPLGALKVSGLLRQLDLPFCFLTIEMRLWQKFRRTSVLPAPQLAG